MGRADGRPGRCDLLRTREARFDSASHWDAIGPPRLRMSVVCVRRSRERGLNTRSVRRRAQARRRFSRLLARRDGGKRCGAPPSAERRAVRPRLAEGRREGRAGPKRKKSGAPVDIGVTGTARSAGGWAFGTGLGGGKRRTPIERAPATTVRIATLPQWCLTTLAPRTMTQQCQTDGTSTGCNPTPYALPRRPATTTAQLLLSLQQLTIATTAAYDYLPTYVANQLTQQQLKWTTTPL